jgi:hypothetical protein
MFARRSPGSLTLLGALGLLLVAGSLDVTSAGAATASSNWAGYVAKGRSSKTRFDHVVGAWRQPAASCVPGRQTYAVFWVGLGGYQSDASKLEQTGTAADCTSTGHAAYFAWYELVPDLRVTVDMRVHPGDAIAASVTASRGSVLVHIRDLTTGRSFAKRVSFPGPDRSSAEWIAEAPSSCDHSNCNVLPLTNFGAVGFTGASALTAGGEAGPISDPAWTTIPIEIQGDPEAFAAATATPVVDSAAPSVLGAAGSSFSVTWQQVTVPGPPSPPVIGLPGGFGSESAASS